MGDERRYRSAADVVLPHNSWGWYLAALPFAALWMFVATLLTGSWQFAAGSLAAAYAVLRLLGAVNRRSRRDTMAWLDGFAEPRSPGGAEEIDSER